MVSSMMLTKVDNGRRFKKSLPDRFTEILYYKQKDTMVPFVARVIAGQGINNAAITDCLASKRG